MADLLSNGFSTPFHNLKGRNVLVVGGGEIALRKVRLVQEASAIITIVARTLSGPAGHGCCRQGTWL